MEREIKDKVYRILFDKNLDSNTKFNRFVDLVLNAYQQGGKDERECYESLLNSDYNEW